MIDCRKCFWFGHYDDQVNECIGFCCASINLIKLEYPCQETDCSRFIPKNLKHLTPSAIYEAGKLEGKEEKSASAAKSYQEGREDILKQLDPLWHKLTEQGKCPMDTGDKENCDRDATTCSLTTARECWKNLYIKGEV
jgi:hypothetical protein